MEGSLNTCRHCPEPALYGRRYCGNIECKRERSRLAAIKSRYGLTPDGLKALQAKYDGKCWLCKLRIGAVVDHCHYTNRVRGWLCRKCNYRCGMIEKYRFEGFPSHVLQYLDADYEGKTD